MSATPQALPGDARGTMSPGFVVLALSLLLGIQPVTTDLYLPALPGLTAALGAPVAQAQLTLSAMLLAFGISQLVWGPLSDRFGRRPILLAGLAAYTAAALGGALAPTMDALVAWRTVQGAAMGAAVMGARAIVRDLLSGAEGARLMSKGMSGLGLIAVLSPPLGGVLAQVAGWRGAMLGPVAFGAMALAIVAWRFEETLPAQRRAPLHPAALARQWLAIVRHPTFLTWSALSTLTYAGLFVYLASSSFVFIRVLGISRAAYGLVLVATSCTYLAATFLCRRMILRLGIRRTLAVAGAIALASGVLVLALPRLAGLSVATLLVPCCLYAMAHGINQPCSQSGSVTPFPQAAGMASSLNGFIMMAVAFAVGGWMGRHLDGLADVLMQAVAVAGAGIAFVNWVLVPRFGDPRHG